MVRLLYILRRIQKIQHQLLADGLTSAERLFWVENSTVCLSQTGGGRQQGKLPFVSHHRLFFAKGFFIPLHSRTRSKPLDSDRKRSVTLSHCSLPLWNALHRHRRGTLATKDPANPLSDCHTAIAECVSPRFLRVPSLPNYSRETRCRTFKWCDYKYAGCFAGYSSRSAWRVGISLSPRQVHFPTKN